MITYNLDLETGFTAEQVAQEVLSVSLPAGILPPGTDVPTLLDPGAALAAGSWLRVGPNSPRPGHTLEVDFDLRPTVWLHFRFYAWKPFPDQKDEMVRLVTSLLDRVPGDCLLHRELEEAWLLRRDGRLYLNDREDIWTPDRLADVPSPYERAGLTFG